MYYDIATKNLRQFGLRSKIYAYVSLGASLLSIVQWAIIDGTQSWNILLTGVCLLLIPAAIYFSAGVAEKLSRIPWILPITFFLASIELVVNFYSERAFGLYPPILVGGTLIWIGRFYWYSLSLRYAKKRPNKP